MINKKIIIFIFLLAIFLLSTGYANFATDLNINGSAKISGEWGIKITDIKKIDVCPNCDAGALIFSDTTAHFNASLIKPGDSVSCEITITNTGTIPAKLEDVVLNTDEEPAALIITTTRPKELLNPTENTTYIITITYDASTTELPETLSKDFTSTVKYVQA